MAGIDTVPVSNHASIDVSCDFGDSYHVFLALDNGLVFDLVDTAEMEKFLQYCFRVYDHWEGLNVLV